MTFADVGIGENFTYAYETYTKTDEHLATPKSFTGPEQNFLPTTIVNVINHPQYMPVFLSGIGVGLESPKSIHTANFKISTDEVNITLVDLTKDQLNAIAIFLSEYAKRM